MFIFGDLVIGVMHDENRLLVCNVFSFSIRCINHVSCIIPSIRLNRAVVWAELCGRLGLIVRSFPEAIYTKTAEDYCRARGIRNYLQPQQSGKPV